MEIKFSNLNFDFIYLPKILGCKSFKLSSLLLPILSFKIINNILINNLSNMAEDRYVFLVEWFDTTADLLRQYNLIYYIKDAAI